MKKFMVMALAIGAFTFASCSDDDDNGASCEELIADFQAAFEVYMDEPNQENCEAYIEAGTALENSDCEGAGQLTGSFDEDECDELE